MKTTPTGFRWALFLLACLVPAKLLSAEETGAKYTTNAADRAECERHLTIIYGALTRYREEHNGELPVKLLELVPDYIRDGKVLICPFTPKRGGLKEWKYAKELSADAYTSYSYEFGLRPLEDFLYRGVPRKTWRDYKLSSVKMFGDIVPVVRCLDHRPYLNLSIGGKIYGSKGLYWEAEFNMDERQQTVQTVFGLPPPPPITPAQFAPRDPRLGAKALDLTPYCNALLTNSWQGFPGNDLASLSERYYEFDGIPFDIRGVIQIAGLEILVPFPARVDGIKVGQKCTRLHFIHAVSTFSRMGATNGFYILHYANGQTREFPIIYGRDIGDWWPDPREGFSVSDATIAWSGQNKATPVYKKSIQLFHSTIMNVLPSEEISSISFDSKGKTWPSGPFVVAITLE